MMTPSPGTISRSAHECTHSCPRRRFLAYEYWRGLPLQTASGVIESHVGGLAAGRYPAPLLIGSSIHEPFAHMLLQCRAWEEIGQLLSWDQMRRAPGWHLVVREAARLGLAYFDRQAAERGVSFGIDPPSQEFYEAEARALVEGLVWVAGLRIVPELVSRYRVVDAEREERMLLDPQLRPFASRADALLEDRGTGELSVFSLKTAAMYTAQSEAQFKRDVQGLSEAIGIEARLAAEAQEQGREDWARIASVQMAILLKGQRRKQGPDLGGRKEHYSPLTRAWCLRDPITGQEEWAWSYETPKTNQKTGEQYMGKLTKDWRVARTWERSGGVERWVLDLDQGRVQPELGDPLMQCLALPEPWARNDREMEDWVEQARMEEKRVETGQEQVNRALLNGDLEQARTELNWWFPQFRSGCVSFNASCTFDAVCWGMGGRGLEILASGVVPEGLAARVDHHEEAGGGDD